MAFPSSPTNGQLYTNALGTQYRYYLADTAWKIVGGPTTNGSVGPGTVGTLAMFTPDTTSVGDSFLVQGSGVITYNTGAVGSSNTSLYQILSDTSYGACGIQCITQGTAASGMSLDMMAVGGSYDPGATSGPNGTTQDNGTVIQATGAAWMDISVGQGRDGTTGAGHLTYATGGLHTSMLTWDATGVGIHNPSPAGIFHPHYDTSSNGQMGINCNVGPSGLNCSSDASTGMVEYRDTVLCGTAADGTSLLAFRLAPSYDMGLIGHLDLHIYNTNDGESRYGHFSIRFFNEGAQSITRDYGDSTLINIGSTGEGARLKWSDSGAPYYAPVFNIETYNSNPSAPYQLDYHMFLRKVTYPA